MIEKNGTIIFTFDDGDQSMYTIAKDIFAKYAGQWIQENALSMVKISRINNKV